VAVIVLVFLDQLAVRAHYRKAGNRQRLAPTNLYSLLDMEEGWAQRIRLESAKPLTSFYGTDRRDRHRYRNDQSVLQSPGGFR
jgi:hypothetical protein